MPVDAQALSAAIEEASGGDAELKDLLTQRLAKSEAAQVAFVGGFMRNKDYSQKTATLAEERRTTEAERKKANDQLSQYQNALEAAEQEKQKILKDLAQHKVTVAGAQARLQHLKDKYQLDDDDVPKTGDLIETRKTGTVTDSTPDLDERLAALKKEMTEQFTKTLLPELAGMTSLDIIWSEMRDEHRELTGKRLTAKEQNDILKEAREKGTSLVAVWEEKFGIPAERKRVERESIVKEERAKWDAEQTARRSQEAMEGIRPGADQSGLRLSPVLAKQFKDRGGDLAYAETVEPKPGEHGRVRAMPSAADRESLTGAERAAKRFLERRAAGVPMGGKDASKTA